MGPTLLKDPNEQLANCGPYELYGTEDTYPLGFQQVGRERERSAYAWSPILIDLLSSQSDGFDGNNT
jgi:hypothetical protein